MKKSHTMYCYVQHITELIGEPAAAKIYLQEVGRRGIITFQTEDMDLADSLAVGDRFEVQLKYKPRKSGVVHVEQP